MNRILLLLLLSPLLCPAQTQIDTLHWSATRRLKLSDFHAPTQPGLGGSEFYYQIGYDVRPAIFSSKPAIDAFCLMFRNSSWVSETAGNERTLAYNQVLFDLVEIHTRQMKAKLIDLGVNRRFKQQAKQIEYLTNAELSAEVNRFRAETGGGDDIEALQKWQQQVAKRLYDTPELVTMYRSSKIGFGLFLGGGVAVPTGPLAQTLNPPPGFVIGLELAYKQTLLLFNTSLYSGTIRTGFLHQNQLWETGMLIRPVIGEVALGHIVRDAPHSRLIPYVGFRTFSLLPRDRTDERYKGFSLTSNAPTAGLIYDFKFSDNAHKPDRAEDNSWFIRTKIGYSPVKAMESFQGGMISLQIGIYGFGRIRKVSYQPQRTVITLPGKSL
ncbi:hypothetical protein BH09BAC4_BH09BAC4_16780 [soil metagenome]